MNTQSGEISVTKKRLLVWTLTILSKSNAMAKMTKKWILSTGFYMPHLKTDF